MNEELKPDLKLVEADLIRDKEDIVSFWTVNFPGWNPVKYDMFYTGGLYGPGVVCNYREPDNNKLIGTHCYFPRLMRIQGRDYMGSISSDLAVLKEYRKYGFATDLMSAVLNCVEKYNIDFIYGHPNQRSENIFIKVGYDTVGTTTRTVKVLKYNSYFQKIVKSSLIASIIAAPFNFIANLLSKENQTSYPEISYEILKRCDERFDELWEKAKDQYPIIGEKSSRWLNWRYFDYPGKEFKVFAVTDNSDNKLIGYYVYHIKENNVLITDCLAVNIDKNIDKIIHTFLKYQRTQMVDSVTFYFFGSKNIINHYLKNGFILRKDHRFFKVYVRKNSPLRDILLNQNNWHYLDGDNDSEP